jgi:hypothetical protein
LHLRPVPVGHFGSDLAVKFCADLSR